MKNEEVERIAHSLLQCACFESVNSQLIIELVRLGHTEHYEPKEIVRTRGEECNEALFLVDGEAFGLFTNPDGRVLQIDHMFAPKLLASATMFSSHSKYPVDVESASESLFLSIPKEQFIKFLMKDETLLKNFLQYISDSFEFVTDRFYEITMKNLVQKVCAYLCQLMDQANDVVVTMDMTKEELAREFGATRPALSRVFTELEKLGVIETEGKKVKIIDQRYVRDYAYMY
ncbi:MAG TPA: Crp/Fnr family transcriptional regulator [Fervidobacterium sp.]|nr:Crp/Fnr family transcriptional regulator [Fervidobacterium sp.]HPT54279.1 Crp/Fnr family transcriptional regulator [Fervidobacterium sp.]HPZ17313.1 Crp/Fnr family transcriptional regulator [Fervidobacterium sp.]HQE48384.1 Crp/Fnr family transcriptional regulator [Fervidobacterium sp.]HUM42079.1 Crp/Fnr family transcriptional regulator [Fervidobacterium sp.]